MEKKSVVHAFHTIFKYFSLNPKMFFYVLYIIVHLWTLSENWSSKS